MEELITSNLFSAFIGSTIGVLFSFFLKKKNEREALTLEFHKEWNSYEMSNHRNIAYIFIKKNPELYYSTLSKHDLEGSISLFIILRFYQRLWQCFYYNHLDKQLAANLFYENFYWYYFISFEKSLKPVRDDWPAYQEIVNLKCKFREYTSELEYLKYKKKYNEKYLEYMNNKVTN